MISVLRAAASSSMAIEAAALACVTVSGMSFGSWKAPATNTPGREVDSGDSRSVAQKPYSLSSMPSVCGAFLADVPGSMPTESTTRSKSRSSHLPVIVIELHAQVFGAGHLDDARGHALDVS